MKHKRLLYFAFEYFYPCGGMNDLRDSFETMEAAMEVAAKDLSDCRELYDTEEGKKYWLKSAGNDGPRSYSWEEDNG